MSKYQDLLGCLDVIMEMDRDSYTVLPGWGDLPKPMVEEITPQAARIFTNSFGSQWIPLNLMRCDTVGNLYLMNWKFAQL